MAAERVPLKVYLRTEQAEKLREIAKERKR